MQPQLPADALMFGSAVVSFSVVNGSTEVFEDVIDQYRRLLPDCLPFAGLHMGGAVCATITEHTFGWC